MVEKWYSHSQPWWRKELPLALTKLFHVCPVYFGSFSVHQSIFVRSWWYNVHFGSESSSICWTCQLSGINCVESLPQPGPVYFRQTSILNWCMLNLQGVPWDNRSRMSAHKLNDFWDSAVCNPSPKAEWKYHELFVSQFKDARSQSGSPKGSASVKVLN